MSHAKLRPLGRRDLRGAPADVRGALAGEAHRTGLDVDALRAHALLLDQRRVFDFLQSSSSTAPRQLLPQLPDPPRSAAGDPSNYFGAPTAALFADEEELSEVDSVTRSTDQLHVAPRRVAPSASMTRLPASEWDNRQYNLPFPSGFAPLSSSASAPVLPPVITAPPLQSDASAGQPPPSAGAMLGAAAARHEVCDGIPPNARPRLVSPSLSSSLSPSPSP